MKLAVIPARGGSKRIPRKNIKPFCGKPMIAWSIEAACACGLFDHVMVSTDDDEIAVVARKYGAEVPFVRPDSLSNDHAGTIPVVAHALDWYCANGTAVDTVCCIYATAPFISRTDLQRGWEILQESSASMAFTVTNYAFPIQRAVRIDARGRVNMFHPEFFSVRSQDLEEAWHDAGQFYWGRAQAWRDGSSPFSGDSVPIKLPRHRVQDIDTPQDWIQAEWLFKALQSEGQV